MHVHAESKGVQGRRNSVFMSSFKKILLGDSVAEFNQVLLWEAGTDTETAWVGKAQVDTPTGKANTLLRALGESACTRWTGDSGLGWIKMQTWAISLRSRNRYLSVQFRTWQTGGWTWALDEPYTAFL